MKAYRFIFLLICLILVTPSSYAENENFPSGVNSNLPIENIQKIQKGITTEEEIYQWFGPPLNEGFSIKLPLISTEPLKWVSGHDAQMIQYPYYSQEKDQAGVLTIIINKQTNKVEDFFNVKHKEEKTIAEDYLPLFLGETSEVFPMIGETGKIKKGVTTEKEIIEWFGEPRKEENVKEPKLKNFPHGAKVIFPLPGGSEGTYNVYEEKQRYPELKDSQKGLSYPWKHASYRFSFKAKDKKKEVARIVYICLIIDNSTGVVEDYYISYDRKGVD